MVLCEHTMLCLYFQKAHEPAFLLPFDFVELKDAINRIASEIVFLHGLLYGVVSDEFSSAVCLDRSK